MRGNGLSGGDIPAHLTQRSHFLTASEAGRGTKVPVFQHLPFVSIPKNEHRSNHCALTQSTLGASNAWESTVLLFQAGSCLALRSQISGPGWAKSLVLSNGDVYFRPRMGKNASFAQQRAVVLSPGDRDEGVVPQNGMFWDTTGTFRGPGTPKWHVLEHSRRFSCVRDTKKAVFGARR